ncbi:4'-phosphopantetheinyl transferase family protein [Fulvivirga lutea]|uniref:4'-phosphopantetheinyl transferase superfamily protein n=1 Tax=Fulvivirga lutea TaxID=2810512 RepID=A0A974WFV5_9BACT|nr:4'-phosphopantetheinyl transferase superfamily protein [Fulvivirga lutea]QSE97739.1 4'-phosphopantetheinyl transferase superfamily protein [Fulvivirga lutea]
MPLEKIEEITPSRHLVLWHINESESELLQLTGNSPELLRKLSEIKVDTKRLELLAAWASLLTLSKSLSFQFNGLSKNENGKPILIGSSREISITHSYPYVAVIHDIQSDVGIDLEQPKDKLLKIAHKFLSEAELKGSYNDIVKLCILWSAKEAMYKIYSKRGLIFNEHMIVEPFDLSKSGTITGLIHMNEYKKKVKLHYRVTPDYVLVFNLD